MIPDFAGPIWTTTQAPIRVWLQQVADELPRIKRDAMRELVVADRDLPVDLVGVVVVKGRVACQHLEEQDAQGPPVHSMVMSQVHDHFRCKVFWGTT